MWDAPLLPYTEERSGGTEVVLGRCEEEVIFSVDAKECLATGEGQTT